MIRHLPDCMHQGAMKFGCDVCLFLIGLQVGNDLPKQIFSINNSRILW